MAVLAADVTVTRFSTSALPVSGRGKAIEELYERGLLPTGSTSCDGAVPHIRITRRVMYKQISLRVPTRFCVMKEYRGIVIYISASRWSAPARRGGVSGSSC